VKPLRPDSGPLIGYLREIDQTEAQQVRETIRALLNTPDGAILMELLEKSLTLRVVPLIADPRAYEYLNAQRFIATDLQQIVSETDAYQSPKHAGSPQRGR
jgi:hypothetical protein